VSPWTKQERFTLLKLIADEGGRTRGRANGEEEEVPGAPSDCPRSSDDYTSMKEAYLVTEKGRKEQAKDQWKNNTSGSRAKIWGNKNNRLVCLPENLGELSE